MKVFNARETVEHRGRTVTVKMVRGRKSHEVEVSDGRKTQSLFYRGKFGASLRVRAIERFFASESE